MMSRRRRRQTRECPTRDSASRSSRADNAAAADAGESRSRRPARTTGTLPPTGRWRLRLQSIAADGHGPRTVPPRESWMPEPMAADKLSRTAATSRPPRSRRPPAATGGSLWDLPERNAGQVATAAPAAAASRRPGTCRTPQPSRQAETSVSLPSRSRLVGTPLRQHPARGADWRSVGTAPAKVARGRQQLPAAPPPCRRRRAVPARPGRRQLPPLSRRRAGAGPQLLRAADHDRRVQGRHDRGDGRRRQPCPKRCRS